MWLERHEDLWFSNCNHHRYIISGHYIFCEMAKGKEKVKSRRGEANIEKGIFCTCGLYKKKFSLVFPSYHICFRKLTTYKHLTKNYTDTSICLKLNLDMER